MAIPKKASAKSTSKKSKAAPAAQPTAESIDVIELSRIGATTARLRSQWPPLTLEEREAFRALATDTQRSKLGKQTKAQGVLREAVAWASQIDRELRLHPDVAEHYTPIRFAYFLERLHGLHERVTAEREQRTQRGATRGAKDSHRTTAVQARRRLLRRLLTFAGKREAELTEIAGAQGTIDTEENIGLSIGALAKLARQWMARTDPLAKIQAKNAGLTAARVEVALKAAKGLVSTSTDATLEGPDAARDSPLVNRDEGDVLLEMDEAMNRFADAQEENEAVRQLSPGAATRHVLGSRKAGKASDEPAAPAAPAAPA
jgi:hypothetical protein